MTKQVDYIFLNYGFASDCTEGPKFIGSSAFLGFDCLLREKGEPERLYRFTRKANRGEACGLKCFERARIAEAEASYHSIDRWGYVDGDKLVITYDGASHKTDMPNDEKLRFRDLRLVDASDGEMAFGRHFFYHPYGTGWARILGAASGDAPTQKCSPHLLQIDPRDVYKPRLKN
jgi:hypothetical protein